MSYKVISTLVTSGDQLSAATESAIALASRFSAHLDFHALGFDRTDPGFYYAGAEAIVLETNIKEARKNQAAAEAAIEERMHAEVTPWSVTESILQQAALQSHMAMRMRFSDLVVLPRPYQDPLSSDEAVTAEACLFEAERPVLMLPEGAQPPRSGGRILLGWNGGAEALSAARAALPFLQQANQVDICIIDPPRHSEDRSDPGGAFAQYLVRHGVKPQIDVLARTEESIGRIMMRRAVETGAEMIVAGAYGHSRLREAVFGGTSRDLLGQCTKPLFMSR
jgi:nucleotide-binding universal stress UspA family protein